MKHIALAALVMISTLPLFAADAPDAAASYKTNCAACHGADGRGLTPVGKSLHVKDLGSEDVQKLTGEEIEKVISEGKGKMPSYKSKLSESEIDALVKLIRTFAPKK